MPNKRKHYFELLIAGVIWGFGFIATVWCLKFLSPAAINSYRFLGAASVGILISLIFGKNPIQWKVEFKLSIISGLLLGLCLFLQTWGLLFTSATNSSFITSLYVVMVPIISFFVHREKLNRLHLVAVALAVIGTGLLVGVNGLVFSVGDFLTLGCAVVASIQIVYLGTAAKKSTNAHILNCLQCLWAGLPFLVGIGIKDSHWNLLSMDVHGWIGLISVTFGSSALAFWLQLRAQKYIPPSTASVFYLLEAPFAGIFAIWLLGESWTLIQGFGAGLNFVACLFAILAHRRIPVTHNLPV